jgi:hypothetical protein
MSSSQRTSSIDAIRARMNSILHVIDTKVLKVKKIEEHNENITRFVRLSDFFFWSVGFFWTLTSISSPKKSFLLDDSSHAKSWNVRDYLRQTLDILQCFVRIHETSG